MAEREDDVAEGDADVEPLDDAELEPLEHADPLKDEFAGVFDSDDLSGGFDSGYETDPVDRFFAITRWQRQLKGLQQRLKTRKLHSFGRKDRNMDPDGVSESSPDQARPKLKGLGTALRQGGEKLREPLRDIRERVSKNAIKMTKTRTRVVSNIKKGPKILKQQYDSQVEELKNRLDKVLARARYAKVRQIRHMICFVCSMADLLVSAFWTGASPHTLHWYYTFKIVTLISTRAIWYRWHGWHYFLFDLCYFSNAVLLAYLWLFPNSEELFMAVYGFSGVLLISVPVFRNSFVPHSLDRVTSVQIHVSPALQMWVLRWYCKESFAIPERLSVVPSICFYAMWAFTYILHQFVFNIKHIERKGYATLYHHMAIDMGIKKKLPKRFQGPAASRACFVVGHIAFFTSGLPHLHLPFFLQTLCLLGAILWAFKNGAAFYITYFWRVYDHQIHEFERQMTEAQAAANTENNIGKNGADCADLDVSTPRMYGDNDEDPREEADGGQADGEQTEQSPVRS